LSSLIQEIEAIESAKPQNATTTLSFIPADAQQPQYQPIVDGVLIDPRCPSVLAS